MSFPLSLLSFPRRRESRDKRKNRNKKRDALSFSVEESRKLVRELGMLYLNQPHDGRSSSHWHALLEIAKVPGITVKALSNLLLLSPSATSRIVEGLIAQEFIRSQEAQDKREKSLQITSQGKEEIKKIDAFSNPRIIGALDYMSSEAQKALLGSFKAYGEALEKSRLERESIKLHTLSTSRPLRNQVIHMIEKIQIDEFSIPITPEINASILKAEEEFSYGNRCHFWYATNKEGRIVGSIGLKMVSSKVGEVKKFFVRKDFRGKGIAHKLMKKLIEDATKNGFETLYLGTVAILEAAQSYYEKIGFEPIAKSDLPASFVVCPVDTVFFKGFVKKISRYFN
jgi:N-acetylglutamate synthase-like GNAT family acetyltransferase/DNA-binding MarR family transcriptional regulator